MTCSVKILAATDERSQRRLLFVAMHFKWKNFNGNYDDAPSLNVIQRMVWDKAPLWAQICTHFLKIDSGPFFHAESESAISFVISECKHLEKQERSQSASHALAWGALGCDRAREAHQPPAARLSRPHTAYAC